MRDSRMLQNTFYIQFAAFVTSTLTMTIGSIVDGVIIGQYLGAESVAAFGIINPLLTVYSVFGAVVATGARTRFTRLVGEGRVRDAQGVFSLSCIISGGLAVVLVLVLLAFARPFATLLGASGNAASLLPKATDYLIGISFGLPAMNLMKTLAGFMPIDNDRRLPIIASAALTIADILLDLSVALAGGGTFGMGLATSVSYYIAIAVLLLHFRRKDRFLRFSPRGIAWRETFAVAEMGAPSGVCRISCTLRSAFLNNLLAVSASTAAIAAYSVHRQTDAVLSPLMLGLADTVCIMAGIMMGEGDRPQMKRLLVTSVEATLLITTGVAVIVFLFAPYIAAIFIKDSPDALAFSTVAVRCYAAGMPFYGLNVIYQLYLQGIEQSKLSLTAGFMLEAGFLMLSAWVMMHWIGPHAVWGAFPVAQVLMFFFYGAVIAVAVRRMGLREEKLWYRVLLVPSALDVPEENQMEGTIRTMEEVVAMSEAVGLFCEERGCDHRRCMLLALCVEEIAGNIVRHGFPKDRKKHSINVRVLKRDEEYTLRICDDCMIFDPLAQLRLFSEEEPAHHIGLRMISDLSREMQYTSIMKLNNLVIKV